MGKGNKNHWLVISPFSHIRYTENTVPRDLIVQIHNEVMDVIVRGIARSDG